MPAPDIYSPRWRRSPQDDFVGPFVRNELVTIRGRAFAGAHGTRSVEFSDDDGESWRPARIEYPGTRLTWTFWAVDWIPIGTGSHVLLSRAVDGTGAPQPADRRSIAPEGATGYHWVHALVK